MVFSYGRPPSILIYVDGTREEVERQIAAAEEKWPEHFIIISGGSLYIGQSKNEMRQEIGLPPLDTPGWDDRRPESDRTGLGRVGASEPGVNGTRLWDIHV